jgi:hypothetical protein
LFYKDWRAGAVLFLPSQSLWVLGVSLVFILLFEEIVSLILLFGFADNIDIYIVIPTFSIRHAVSSWHLRK